jgi:hypothetical protein
MYLSLSTQHLPFNGSQRLKIKGGVKRLYNTHTPGYACGVKKECKNNEKLKT